MKAPPSHLFVPFLAACILTLTSCGVPYDHRSYVRGTGFGIDHEPIPAHVTVVDSRGNTITSGYSNRDAFYFNRRYYGNRYYGGMLYGYNNPPVAYLPANGTGYAYRAVNARTY